MCPIPRSSSQRQTPQDGERPPSGDPTDPRQAICHCSHCRLCCLCLHPRCAIPQPETQEGRGEGSAARRSEATAGGGSKRRGGCGLSSLCPVFPAPIVTLADLDMARVLQELSKRDSKLGLIIRKFGPPTSLMDHVSGDSFKALARGIVFQQLATRVAAKIFDRLAEACGGDAAFSPTTMKRLKEQKGRAAGLSARKFEYLQSLADAFLSGVISQEILTKLPDADCTTRLCVLRGIGEWSAHMFMMFTLARADVFPYGDFGMRKAFQRVYNCGSPGTADLPKRGEMEAIAEKWRPYRTVGSWYMWRSLETQTP
eukprot:GGOE01045628.1.p1 GENE.GGOE01045628.1~~GGOE01045628.1.p1  ORF type:complete len:313 (-),score=57.21 GGOE01045628.1:166-1104(-)